MNDKAWIDDLVECAKQFERLGFDAERSMVCHAIKIAAPLQTQLDRYKRISESGESLGGQIDEMEKRMELEAQLAATQETLSQCKNEIGDLQGLCERAHLIIGELWDKTTDGTEYGPNSILRDLKKAMEGQEYKDLTSLANAAIKSNTELEKELSQCKREREAAVAAERERCAKVAEDMDCAAGGYHTCLHNDAIAKAIRGGSDE